MSAPHSNSRRTAVLLLAGGVLVIGLLFYGRGIRRDDPAEGDGAPAGEAIPASRPGLSEPVSAIQRVPETHVDLASLSLDELVGAPASDRAVVEELIERLPRYKGSQRQYVVTSHIANIATDEDYPLVEALILAPEALEPAALDVLLADLHSRIDEVKLPVFAEICDDRQHPSFNEAFQSLRTYFETDGTDDLPDWQVAARELAADEDR